MKKILFLLLILMGFNVYADSCSKEELARLKNIANQVELTYEYEKKTEKFDGHTYAYMDYTIIATNLNKEIVANYEVDYLTGKYYSFKRDGNIGKLSGFEDGENITVTIRAYTADDCSGKVLAKKSIKMPYMNQYYYSFDNCKDHQGFKYCHEVLDEKVNYEKFVKEYNEYIGITDSKVDNTSEVNIEEGNNNVILLIGIVIFAVSLILIITFTIIKKKKKDNL